MLFEIPGLIKRINIGVLTWEISDAPPIASLFVSASGSSISSNGYYGNKLKCFHLLMTLALGRGVSGG